MGSHRTGSATVAGLVLALVALVLAGCSSAPEAAASAASSPQAASAGSSPTPAPTEPAAASDDPAKDWCDAYSQISGDLASAGTSPDSAADTLTTLDSFDLLWTLAGKAEFLTPDEVAANSRAVAAYAAIIRLVADGAAQDSPEVKAASADLTAVTDADRELLKSSAGKVVALCGAPSGAPTAPPTPSG